MTPRIWLSPPHMNGHEMKYIQEAFDTNWIAPIGPNIDAFENNLREYTGAKNVVALASGTAALHLALCVLGIQSGDLVLCQSLTFAASANPITYLNAIPVFIDSEPDTWNVCPDALENAIKHYQRIGKKPKAVICVHLYGMPCKILDIKSICEKYGLVLIEDAAEALGSEYEGQKLGTFGDLGIFSFNGNKIITTSGGGALVSSNQKYIEKARYLATQAREPVPHFEHKEIGYNYRMSNISAGIGRGQMEVLPERVLQRRRNFAVYKRHLGGVENIRFQEEPPAAFSNRWLTALLLSETSESVTPEKIRLALEARNIESRPLWKPMHLQPVFTKCEYWGGEVAENLFRRGLCLPSGSDLSESSIFEICEVISLTL
ncbi:aminotransferase class I/II-fold pyridoxal phosphate-dependent enzyme [Dyadobacter luticola]|uniref:GDP-perosamine synthase n=1 Tax=Dyadobacter luticola TaxID=1979387 RepID=A0A5R9KP37_9BACT|nr:aminotransferase class I/II-fold pyridoxal phosphate-dependent enzyme [Dyadobacter luticola]TLU98051.1 aminotransferase class I/II-fold pyridoxal phosphate-dependent enzyme [Dyadobacter luticola]